MVFIDVQVLNGLLRYLWLRFLFLNSRTSLLLVIFLRFAIRRLLGLISRRKYGLFVFFLFCCTRVAGLRQLTPWSVLIGLLDIVRVLTGAQRILWAMRGRRSPRLFLLDVSLDDFDVSVGRKILLHKLLFPWPSLNLGIVRQLDDLIHNLIFIYVLKLVSIAHLLNLLLDILLQIIRKLLKHFSCHKINLFSNIEL